jgi:hypothetical protein
MKRSNTFTNKRKEKVKTDFDWSEREREREHIGEWPVEILIPKKTTGEHLLLVA